VTNGVFASTSAADNGFLSGHAMIARTSVGVRSNIYLDTIRSTPPQNDAYSHAQGELISTTGGDLWYCTSPGGTGADAEWRQLAGNDTAGSFHAVSPARVYDSRRLLSPNPTPLASGQNRVVSVKDRRDVTTGAVNGSNVVPLGATAIAFNITIVNTSGGAFLTVTPGDETAINSSTINWDAATTAAVANSSVVKLDGSRQIKVWCGGVGGATNFIIDVVGYYL
jgi:hypothetical protein